jgi:hypothetical protein
MDYVMHRISSENIFVGVRKLRLIQCYNWDLFDHPAHSLNLAQSDYHLFNYKNWFRPQPNNIKGEVGGWCQTAAVHDRAL